MYNIGQNVNVSGVVTTNVLATAPEHLPQKQQLDNAVAALSAVDGAQQFAIDALPTFAEVDSLISAASGGANVADFIAGEGYWQDAASTTAANAEGQTVRSWTNKTGQKLTASTANFKLVSHAGVLVPALNESLGNWLYSEPVSTRDCAVTVLGRTHATASPNGVIALDVGGVRAADVLGYYSPLASVYNGATQATSSRVYQAGNVAAYGVEFTPTGIAAYSGTAQIVSTATATVLSTSAGLRIGDVASGGAGAMICEYHRIRITIAAGGAAARAAFSGLEIQGTKTQIAFGDSNCVIAYTPANVLSQEFLLKSLGRSVGVSRLSIAVSGAYGFFGGQAIMRAEVLTAVRDFNRKSSGLKTGFCFLTNDFTPVAIAAKTPAELLSDILAAIATCEFERFAVVVPFARVAPYADVVSYATARADFLTAIAATNIPKTVVIVDAATVVSPGAGNIANDGIHIREIALAPLSELIENALTDNVTRKYTTTIGNGAATVFTITHNLNTLNVSVKLRDIINPAVNWLENITARTANTVELTFAAAPAAANFCVLVIG